MQPGWIAGYLSKQIVQFMHVYAQYSTMIPLTKVKTLQKNKCCVISKDDYTMYIITDLPPSMGDLIFSFV